ncbi:AzlC family ABC transporter permease [Spiractinospora alimapuensis]|uniref:AzlC family ABC transporter permease n=1 Tax=Spiractinospora alimapuensis TaxID=2820884 RepID=UPI001F233C9F|nr:AzlC family ABC transporter permease [Spiractinospora alimapuensis]QVQ53116.1 AzlC family ABC transporter permease [Spiractinospora alimapuensis]
MIVSQRAWAPPVRDGLGVGVAAGFAGLAFGTSAVTAGLSVAQASVLSVLAFTGASQFALVGVIAGGGNLAAGVVGAMLLGARNTLYGLRLADVLGWRGTRKIVATHGVIDESTAVALAQRDRDDARLGFATTAVTTFVCWNVTTVVGAVATGHVGDISALGLDAVVPAVFLALLWSRLRHGGRERWVALGGVAIALATTTFLPAGVPVLCAAIAALVATLAASTRPTETSGGT